jgi:ADP-heptose:LPS heptosyltransferase
MKKKILVIRFQPLKYFIHCIPAFAAIRKRHENDEVTILTESSLVDFCKSSRLFDKVWLDIKPEWFQILALKDLIRRLKAGKFDMVYDLQNDNRSKWYFKLIGYKKPMWNSSVIDWCSHYHEIKEDDNMHFQDLIYEQLNITGIKSMPMIDISYMANDSEGSELPADFAMICSGGDRAKMAHKWNPSNYAEIIDYLHTRYNITSVLVGDRGDDALINALVAKQCVSAKPINYSGKTDINGIISLAKKARFCLGNETAPTHIAAYSNCRTVMLCSRFSPADLLAPRVRNLAVVEEPVLDNIEVSRVKMAIEDFAMASDEVVENKPFKAKNTVRLENPEILSKIKNS